MFTPTHIRSRQRGMVALTLVLSVILTSILIVNPDSSLAATRVAPRSPDKVTLYTADGSWKVEASAWITNVGVYKSIGTSVTTYTRRRVGGFLGLFPRVDWVETPVDAISIQNAYSGLPHDISRSNGWSNTGHAELFEWAVGVNISIDDQGNPGGGGGAILDLRRVDGSFQVQIGREHLAGVVMAGH